MNNIYRRMFHVGLFWPVILLSQPVANFSINPNPVCSGSVIQITDLSTGNPTSWSYTVTGPTTVLTGQNPTLQVSGSGTRSVTLVAANGTGSSTPIMKTFSVIAAPLTVINPSFAITCPGGAPITLTVNNPGNAPYTYSWSNGATSNSIVVSPTTTTVYSVVVTNTSGCASILTKTVTSAFPVVSISANPLSICQNGASTLIATSSGQPPYTYSWSTGASTRTISTNVPGIYTVTFTTNNGCQGTQTISLPATNTLLLVPKSSPSVVCLGDLTFLSATGATTYSWSTGATTSLTGVTPGTTTTYTVWGATSTCTGVAVTTVTVNMTPTLVPSSSSVNLCLGNTTVLSATGANTYSWNTGAQTSTIAVSPTLNTTYTVSGENSPCTAVSTTILVFVKDSPTLQITSSKSVACSQDKVVLTAGGASTYTWSNGSNGTLLTFTATSTATYSVIGVDNNGCSATIQFTQNVLPCTGLAEEYTVNQVRIYPTISSEPIILSSVSIQVEIISIDGMLVRKIRLRAGEPFLVNGLTEGSYFLKIQSNQSQLVRRFFISH